MWPDRVSDPGPLTYESGALPTALCGLATCFLTILKGPKKKMVRFSNIVDRDEVVYIDLSHLDILC